MKKRPENGAAVHTKKSAVSRERARETSSWNKVEVLADYRLAVESRQASITGRKEVLTGKAKFGIFGDGKEIAQLAMARVFQPGDWRSGYYRDQTFMFAIGESNVQKFFAQLYAHTDIIAEPSSAGRSMNGHFGTRFLSPNGDWNAQSESKNVSADVSPTGSQMPRLVGLAYASRLYREIEELKSINQHSKNGNEVAFGTIGNASCAEGVFWESVNAIGVLKVPAIISVWDDGYGISVPNNVQVTKSDVGELLSGFQRVNGDESGFDIQVVRGWDYPALIQAYERASEVARTQHVPQIIHVIEVTQPLGHSTSGSHERYKSPERLQWEVETDGITRMRNWIVEQDLATAIELDAIEEECAQSVQKMRDLAWSAYIDPIRADIQEACTALESLATQLLQSGLIVGHEDVMAIASELQKIREPFRKDIMTATHKALVVASSAPAEVRSGLLRWRSDYDSRVRPLYASHLTDEIGDLERGLKHIGPIVSAEAPSLNGSEIIRSWFNLALARDPRVLIFGEDAGKLGDVNQGTLGLQEIFGELRVSDTGIRECSIVGQAIGLAMRGLRPIAEIQYLDYLLYALQLMSDDLATVRWRTRGGQAAPVIIRTRGHRLEGIWHSGSPMAGIINLVRGIHVCVPRNFVQASGMYETLLRGQDPGLVVEVLNGYRLKESLPDNLGEYTIELGVPEVLRTGTDITVVSYGATLRPIMDAAITLERLGISVEVVDVQTLLPFDIRGVIVESLKKTNRLLIVDEDVPGGTCSYIMREVLEVQNGYRYLDSAPKTLSAAPHRPAYGTDGNYWSKPEMEHVIDAAYSIMHETDPSRFSLFS